MTTIRLSSYEFRAFRASRNEVSLRLSAYLFVDSRDNGHIKYFFHNPKARVKLPNAMEVELDVSWTEHVEFRTARPDVYLLWLSRRISQNDYSPGAAVLTIDYTTCFSPDDYYWSHTHDAIVRRLPHSKLG